LPEEWSGKLRAFPGDLGGGKLGKKKKSICTTSPKPMSNRAEKGKSFSKYLKKKANNRMERPGFQKKI